MKTFLKITLLIIIAAFIKIAADPNIEELMKNFQKFDNQEKVKASKVIAEYYLNRNSTEGLDYLLKGLKAAEIINKSPDIALLHTYIGDIYNQQENFDYAIYHYNSAILHYHVEKDKLLRYEIYSKVGKTYYIKKKYKEASNSFTQQIAIAKETKDPIRIAEGFKNRASANFAMGNLEESLSDLKNELYQRELIVDKKASADAINKIANIYSSKRDDQTALKYFNSELRIREETNDKKGMANALNNIGRVIDEWGNYEKAIEYFKKEEFIRLELGNASSTAFTYFCLGSSYNKIRNYNAAISSFTNELNQYEKTSNKAGQADAYSHIGMVYNRDKKYPKALEYYLKELDLRRMTNDKEKEAISNFNIADIYLRQQNFNKALIYYQNELAIHESLNNDEKVALSLENIARVYYKQKNYFEAEGYFKKQLELQKKSSNRPGLISAYENLGLLFKSESNFPRAQENLLVASNMSKDEYGASSAKYAQSLIKLADLYIPMGKLNEAENLINEAIRINAETVGTNHPDYAMSLYSLAAIYNIKGKNAAADSIYSLAMEIMQQELGENFAYFKVKDFELLKKDRDLKALQLRDEINRSLIRLKENENLRIKNNLSALLIEKEKNLRQAQESENKNLKAEKKVKELLLSKTQVEMDKKSNFVTLLFIIVALLITLIAGGIHRLSHKRKTALTLEEKNRSLEEKNHQLIVSKSELQKSHEEKDKYLQILDSELENASAYVISLLPEPVKNGSLETCWKYIPSIKLGGDSFGYHWIDSDNLAIYLLDVCGHGVGSALYSVSVLNVLKLQNLPDTDFHKPEDVLMNLNKKFQMKFHNEMYFTIWYGVFNKTTRELAYSCGGHPPALLINGDGKVEKLFCKNLFIGGMPDYKFKSYKTIVNKDSHIYIFSDGVYEVEKPDGKMMQFNELEEFLSKHNVRSGKEIDLYFDYVTSLTGRNALDDDFSMLKISLK